MPLLQLAESPYNMLAENEMFLAEQNTVGENYLFIPSGLFGMDEDTYVRSDFFDSLSDQEFDAVIETLAPFQPQGLSAVGAIASGLVMAGKKAAPGIQKAVANRQAKVAAGTVQPIFKPGGTLANLATKVKAGVGKLKNVPVEKTLDVIERTTPVTGQLDIGGTSIDFTSGQQITTANFFTKYRTPLLIGGGLIGAFILAKATKIIK